MARSATIPLRRRCSSVVEQLFRKQRQAQYSPRLSTETAAQDPVSTQRTQHSAQRKRALRAVYSSYTGEGPRVRLPCNNGGVQDRERTHTFRRATSRLRNKRFTNFRWPRFGTSTSTQSSPHPQRRRSRGGDAAPLQSPSGADGGWCEIPNLSIDGVAGGVSVNVWNAKRCFLERMCGTILWWTS